MRKLIVSIKKRIDRLLMPRYRVVSRYGCRLLVDNRNWIDARIIVRKPYENEQLAVCADIIRERGIDTFIDVGANFGLYTMVLNRTSGLRQTYAFEPVASNYYQLCGNIFVNQLTDRVTPVRKALSDSNGSTVIHVDPASTGVSRLSLADSGRDNRVFVREEQINTARLDEELPLSGRRLLIKIDVEGHEMAALQGMTRTLADNRVCLQIEAFGEARLKELDAFFEPLGYRRDGVIGSDYRYSNFAD